MDAALYRFIEKKGGEHARHLELLSQGGGWLLLELGGASRDDVRRAAEEAVRRAGPALVDSRVYLDPKTFAALWDAREGALGATAFLPGEPDTWPGWEDSAVPTEKLGSYLRALCRLFDAYGYAPSVYGHFGMGLVHCRIPFDLYTEGGVDAFRGFMSDAADLVVAYGGSLSGEHGDGQSRAELLVKMFGPELIDAMRELKAIFDPQGRMNPARSSTRIRSSITCASGRTTGRRGPRPIFDIPTTAGASRARRSAAWASANAAARTARAPAITTSCARATWSPAKRSTRRGAARTSSGSCSAATAPSAAASRTRGSTTRSACACRARGARATAP